MRDNVIAIATECRNYAIKQRRMHSLLVQTGRYFLAQVLMFQLVTE